VRAGHPGNALRGTRQSASARRVKLSMIESGDVGTLRRDIELGSQTVSLDADRPVACVWGRGPFDKALAAILAHLLVKAICFSSLAIGRSSAQIRHYVRRLRHQAGRAKTVLCLWGHDIGDLRGIGSRIDLDSDFYASSFKEVIACLLSPRFPNESEKDTSSAVNAA
jgi:hypothetical protein